MTTVSTRTTRSSSAAPFVSRRTFMLAAAATGGAGIVSSLRQWSMVNVLGSLAPLPTDPLPNVSRATKQLDAVPFMCGEEAHHREIHECRLRQVRTRAVDGTAALRLQLDQVILLDAPTEPERRRVSRHRRFRS